MDNAAGPSSSHRLTAHFSGRVQGVGFRYTVRNLAIRYNVSGFVRNLPDGHVEMVVEGPDEEMDQLVEAVKQKMTGFIGRTDLSRSPANGEFNGFSIKH